MKTLLATGAALGLVMAAAPATAQSAMDDTMATAPTQLSPEQQTMYDGWPDDRRATYDAWPAQAQSYYWTLDQDQTRGWWMLNDEQRVQIVEMAPEQRTAAWASIMAQLNGGPPPAAPAENPAMGSTPAPGTNDMGSPPTTGANTATAPTSARAPTGDASARATTGGGNIEYRSIERVQPTPGDEGSEADEMEPATAP